MYTGEAHLQVDDVVRAAPWIPEKLLSRHGVFWEEAAEVLCAQDATPRERRLAEGAQSAMRKQIPHPNSREKKVEFRDTADTTDDLDPGELPPEATHGEKLMQRLGQAISIRMDGAMLQQLRRLAAKRRMGYQTMMRMWVAERLEQELAKEAQHTRRPVAAKAT